MRSLSNNQFYAKKSHLLRMENNSLHQEMLLHARAEKVIILKVLHYIREINA